MVRGGPLVIGLKGCGVGVGGGTVGSAFVASRGAVGVGGGWRASRLWGGRGAARGGGGGGGVVWAGFGGGGVWGGVACCGVGGLGGFLGVGRSVLFAGRSLFVFLDSRTLSSAHLPLSPFSSQPRTVFRSGDQMAAPPRGPVVLY